MNEKDRHGRFLARFWCSSGVENISKASESKRAEPTDVHGPLDAAGIDPASGFFLWSCMDVRVGL